MIIFYIAMSKKDGLKNLAAELAAMPDALLKANITESGNDMVLARVVEGISEESLLQALHSGHLSEWTVFPLENGVILEDLETPGGQRVPVSPFGQISGLMSNNSFQKLLKGELARVSRNGGCLSIVSAGLANRSVIQRDLGEEDTRRLEALLGSILLKHLESCDSLGLLRPGQFMCCLPGMGQLAARGFSEKAQSAFQEEAQSCYPEARSPAKATCAMGIINLLQGETGVAPDLVRRAKLALEMAMNKKNVNIYQETSMAPLENTTLVHSSEKRFLFFGGTA